MNKMKYYAEGIQKFQRQLGLAVYNFSDILKEEMKNDLDQDCSAKINPNREQEVEVTYNSGEETEKNSLWSVLSLRPY